MSKVLIIEPFYGGSHKQLIDLIEKEIECCLGHNEVMVCVMTAKKWHWRARTAALYLSQTIPTIDSEFKTLFASSVLNLAELVAIRPDISRLRKVLYFHENQLIYPKREQKGRDFQYGYNQLLSCLVADVIVFNSKFNMNSFLSNIKSFIKIMPDYRPKQLETKLLDKCRVIYYPIIYPTLKTVEKSDHFLHILWPHRWEHDKNPEDFFKVLFQLKEENVPFRLSVIGETYDEKPEIFNVAKNLLESEIVNWGYVEDKADYWKILSSCHVVVSTANHEFFGVAMIEASYCGCYPLCPNRLVYNEIFGQENLYNSLSELTKKLKKLVKNVKAIEKVNIEFEKYDWNALKQVYMTLL